MYRWVLEKRELGLEVNDTDIQEKAREIVGAGKDLNASFIDEADFLDPDECDGSSDDSDLDGSCDDEECDE